MGVFAWLSMCRGKIEQVEGLLQEAFKFSGKAFGETSTDTAYLLKYQAILFIYQQRYASTQALYQRALAIRERPLGADHPDTRETSQRYHFSASYFIR